MRAGTHFVVDFDDTKEAAGTRPRIPRCSLPVGKGNVGMLVIESSEDYVGLLGENRRIESIQMMIDYFLDSCFCGNDDS
jgi:hypothetical protein